MELIEAEGEERNVEENQSPEDSRKWQMRKLRHHGAAETFARVNQGIHQDGLLKDGEFFERAPGIVGATEKDHGRHDEAEHQADVRLLHAAAEGEAAGRGEKRDQQSHQRKKQRMSNV